VVFGLLIQCSQNLRNSAIVYLHVSVVSCVIFGSYRAVWEKYFPLENPKIIEGFLVGLDYNSGNR